jgi:hypothetical protein
METKENYTRGEADFMSVISAVVGDNPHTFQGNSAYWELVEVDFETKEIKFQVLPKNKPKHLFYSIVGIATAHHYNFTEIL